LGWENDLIKEDSTSFDKSAVWILVSPFFSIPRATEFCFFNPQSSIPLKFVGMSGREGEGKVILINFVSQFTFRGVFIFLFLRINSLTVLN